MDVNTNDKKIMVTNTAIIINDYHLGDCPQLEHIFSIYDPVTHKFVRFAMLYDQANCKLYIPAGVDLWKIKSYFNERYYTRINNHPYKMIDHILMKYKPRDDKQLEALRFMCGIGEEWSANQDLPQLSLNLNTGDGKTYCSIATIVYYKMKAIIITGSTSLLEQWKLKILEYTNLTPNRVLKIDAAMFPMILSGKSKKTLLADIYLCTHKALQSYGDKVGWNMVYQLFETLGIGLKFYDECHSNYENIMQIDFFTNVWKTYYVTATPGRSSKFEDRIFQLSLKNVPSIDLFDENGDPRTAYVAIKYNSRPTPQQISMCKSRVYGIDRMAYIDYLVKQPAFYNALRIIMELVLKCKGRVLIYVGKNEAILTIYEWLGRNYHEFIGDIGIFCSLVGINEKLKERDKKLIITNTKSAGAGEDIPNLKMTIVLAEPFASTILARQTLGRTRDRNTMYIELVDMGFIYTKKFYNNKLPTFKKYATDVSDTFLDNYELSRRAANIKQARDEKGYVPIFLQDDRFGINTFDPNEENPTDTNIVPIKSDNQSKYKFVGNNPFIKSIANRGD